jgi:hypothetical protein
MGHDCSRAAAKNRQIGRRLKFPDGAALMNVADQVEFKHP